MFTHNPRTKRRDEQTRFVRFGEPVPVPNYLTKRKDVMVRLIGYERSKNPVTGRWLSLMRHEWKRTGLEWSECRDIVTQMNYADHYYFLHDMPTNYNLEYGKVGRRKPVYCPDMLKAYRKFKTDWILKNQCRS